MEPDRAPNILYLKSNQIFIIKTNSPSRKKTLYSLSFISLLPFLISYYSNRVWIWFLPALVVYFAASPGADPSLWLLLVEGFVSCIKISPLAPTRSCSSCISPAQLFPEANTEIKQGNICLHSALLARRFYIILYYFIQPLQWVW